MIEVLGQLDFGAVGVGSAFGAGVWAAMHWGHKALRNGRDDRVDRLAEFIDRAERRDERMMAILTNLDVTQGRTAALLDVIVKRICG